MSKENKVNPTKREREIAETRFPEFKGMEIKGMEGKMNEFLRWAMIDHFAQALAEYRCELNNRASLLREALKHYRYHADPKINNIAQLALAKDNEMMGEKG